MRLREISEWSSLILDSDPFLAQAQKREHLRKEVEPRGLWGSGVEAEIQGTQMV